MHSAFDTDSHVDIPFPSKKPVTEGSIEVFLRRHATASSHMKGNLDVYNGKGLEVLRMREEGHAAVWAYQVVTVSKIEDLRSEFGHPDTLTVKDEEFHTKLTVILGEKLKRTEADKLEAWLRNEQAQDVRDQLGFEKRFISMNALDSFGSDEYRKSRSAHVIKIGTATFLPYDPKRMALAFRQSD